MKTRWFPAILLLLIFSSIFIVVVALAPSLFDYVLLQGEGSMILMIMAAILLGGLLIFLFGLISPYEKKPIDQELTPELAVGTDLNVDVEGNTVLDKNKQESDLRSSDK